MNKICTSLEESKKLAKILPLESADMHWQYIEEDDGQLQWFYFPKDFSINQHDNISCWSLSALLNVLPKIVNHETLFVETSATLWHIGYRNVYIARAANLVDACYELILELHEQKLL